MGMKSFFTWDEIDAYLIKRPWHQVFTFDIKTMLNSIYACGFFNVKVMEQLFSPLFSAIDISLNITMQEFYEKTGIDIHIYVTKMENISSICSFELLDISYKTHPEWRLIDAVYCSSALPIAPMSARRLCLK
jgi:hypothetical protein